MTSKSLSGILALVLILAATTMTTETFSSDCCKTDAACCTPKADCCD